MESSVLSVIGVLVGIVAFGTYMVPLKKWGSYSSWSFLMVESIGALACAAVIACVMGSLNLHPVGIGCGLMWVIGGALCFWAVQAEADLAGTALRSMSVSILLSFVTGITLFHEQTNLALSIPAIVCMLVGIYIPAPHFKSLFKNWRSLGSGAIFGTYLIPYNLSGMGDMEFLFPFAFGICVGCIALVSCMMLKRRKSFGFPMVPTVASFFSGALWMFGTLAIFWAIAPDGYFGYAVGYPLLQLNLVVNQMWGVFAFGEYATRNERIKLVCSTIVILAGAVLLTVSKL